MREQLIGNIANLIRGESTWNGHAADLARKIIGLVEATHTLTEQSACTHAHYLFTKHGRRCTCGVLMYDPGD